MRPTMSKLTFLYAKLEEYPLKQVLLHRAVEEALHY